MRKVIVLFSALFLAVLFNFILSEGVSAEKSLNDVKEERKEIKKDLSEAEKKVADVLLELKDLNTELDELKALIDENEKVLSEVVDEKDEVEDEIEEIENRIEERFNLLKDRARSYQSSGGSIQYIEVIFNSSSFSEFLNRITTVSTIAKSDTELIKAQEEDKEIVEGKLTELEELQKEYESIEENLLGQKDSIDSKKEEVNKKKEKLSKVVSKLKVKDKDLKKLENKIVAEQSKPKEVTTSSASGSPTYTGGKLGWPTVGGYISSGLGQRWGRMHNGVDIARTDRSTSPPIFAAEAGTVESAGHRGSFGNLIVINHGNGMKTKYAHMSSISVSSGQKVSKGQTLGVMGRTGNATGIHLHFEVHVNGSIQNPLNYIK